MQYSHDEKKQPLLLLTGIILAVAGLLAGFMLARLWILPFTVRTASMEPTLKPGANVLVLKRGDARRGDLVLLQSPIEEDRVLVLRVLAVESDTVEIRNKVFYINDAMFHFPWTVRSRDQRAFPLTFTNRDNMPAVKLKRNEFFLVGDDLDRSFDSRSFGPVRKEDLVGRVIHIFK